MGLWLKMTYENCLKYAKEYREAGDEEKAIFWEERAKRKKQPIKMEEENKIEEVEETEETEEVEEE